MLRVKTAQISSWPQKMNFLNFLEAQLKKPSRQRHMRHHNGPGKKKYGQNGPTTAEKSHLQGADRQTNGQTNKRTDKRNFSGATGIPGSAAVGRPRSQEAICATTAFRRGARANHLLLRSPCPQRLRRESRNYAWLLTFWMTPKASSRHRWRLSGVLIAATVTFFVIKSCKHFLKL